MKILANKCDKDIVHQTRKIKPTRRSVSGSFSFRKIRAIQFESTLERDFITLQEFNLFVEDVIPQPVKIPFCKNGHDYQYTPDFIVYYRTINETAIKIRRPLLVEVKPRAKVRENWQKWKPKFKAALKYAHNKGWDFRICDEARIRNKALENIHFLQRYQRMDIDLGRSQSIISAIRTLGPIPIRNILSELFQEATKTADIALIYHLVATRQLECEISKPLDNSTIVWAPENDHIEIN